MANQSNPGLSIAADQAILQASRVIAISKLFTHNYSNKAAMFGAYVKIPVCGSGAAQSYNAVSNNYATVDAALGHASVFINTKKKHTFAINADDMYSGTIGSVWDREGEAGGRAIAKAIESDIMGLFTYDNAMSVTGYTGSTVTKANFAQLVALCATAGLDPADCTVILTPTAYATLLASLDSNVYGSLDGIQNGIIKNLYGFKAVIYSSCLPTASSSASSDTKAWGVIVPTGAVAVASAPIMGEAADLAGVKDFGESTDPESGLVFSSFRFGTPGTLDCMATVVCQYGVALTYSATTCDKAPRFIQLHTT